MNLWIIRHNRNLHLRHRQIPHDLLNFSVKRESVNMKQSYSNNAKLSD
jgi:hypothetical protein